MYAQLSNGSYGNIHDITVNNENYRKVIDTTCTQQLVVMSLKPKVEIGEEIHPYNTQYIKIEHGSCTAMLNNKYIKLKKDDYILIPPNTLHNIINTSNDVLKLYTIYSPPHHDYNKVEK
jgi:mannose-6-phosphate isomerase-like protein (cupin superfamily)